MRYSLSFALALWAALGLAAAAPARAELWEPVTVGHSQKCLDSTTGAEGAPVVQHECHGGDNQKWRFDNGHIVERRSQKCLTSDGTATRSFLVTRSCVGAPNQTWDYRTDGTIVSPAGLCVDVLDHSKDNQGRLILWTCQGEANQRWDSRLAPRLWSEFRVRHSGKCLDVTSAFNQAPLVQYDCHGRDNQKWTIEGRQIIEKQTGRCLDATDNKRGSTVTIHDCHGGRNQMWRWFGDGGIVNDQSGKCVDVLDSLPANGTRIILWDCHEGANQRWDTAFAKERWVEIFAVETVVAAGGINDVARFFAQAGGYLVGAALTEYVPVAGETIVVLAEEIVDGDSGDVGEAILEAVDGLVAGADDLYVTVAGRKVAPSDRSHWSSDAGDRQYPTIQVPLVRDVVVELIERDIVSGDDSMGTIIIPANHELVKQKELLVASKEEGSLYRVIFTVSQGPTW